MEKRNIQIDVHTARKWYKLGGFYKDLALQAFTTSELETSELPKSWEEYESNCSDRVVHFHLSKHKSAILSLQKLIVIRDIYRQGWEPDWFDSYSAKICIYAEHGRLNTGLCHYIPHLFAFQTEKLAKQFLENFQEELEQLKELL